MRLLAGLILIAVAALGALALWGGLRDPESPPSPGPEADSPPPSLGWSLSPPAAGEDLEEERDLLELEDQLAEDLYLVLEKLVDPDPLTEEALRTRLLRLLQDQSLGEETERSAIAASLTADLLRRRPANPASLPKPGSRDDLVRQQALRRLARAYAAQLRLRTLKRRDPEQQHPGKELRATPPVDLPPGVVAVDWKLLSGLGWKEGEPVPAAARELDGKTVGIGGWMVSLEGVEDVRTFALVESNWSCCFGLPVEVTHVVVTSLAKPASVINAAITVIGRLEVGPRYDDGYLISFWRLSEARIVRR